MAWIPEDQRTPAWEIWNLKFHCRMPYNQSRSIDDIKRYGHIASGDMNLDRQRSAQPFETMLTINQMAEYFRQGADLYLKKKSDTKRVYEIISNHLESWQRFLLVNLHIKGPPVDDLMLLDKFAGVVYEHAKRIMSQDFTDSLAARQLETAAGFSVDSMLVDERRLNKDANQIEEDPIYPERFSYSEGFSRQRRMNMRWR